MNKNMTTTDIISTNTTAFSTLFLILGLCFTLLLSSFSLNFTPKVNAVESFDNFRSTIADFENFKDINIDYTNGNAPTSLQADAILNLKARGIVSGFSDGTFKPDNKLSRGEMSKFVVNSLYGKDYKNQSCPNFGDNKTSDTFYSFIHTLKCEGVVSGFEDGSFKPLSEVSRGEALKFVFEAMFKKYPKLEEKLLESKLVEANGNGFLETQPEFQPKSGVNFFTDIPEKNSPESTFYKYSSYAKYYFGQDGFLDYAYGLVNGQSAKCKKRDGRNVVEADFNKFCPNDKITRQEMAFLVFSGMMLTNLQVDSQPNSKSDLLEIEENKTTNLFGSCFTFGCYFNTVGSYRDSFDDDFNTHLATKYPKNLVIPLISGVQGDFTTNKNFTIENPTNKLTQTQTRLYVLDSGQSDSVQIILLISGYNAGGDYLEFNSYIEYGDTLADEEQNFILTKAQIDICNKKTTNEVSICIREAILKNFETLDDTEKATVKSLLEKLMAKFGY